MTDWLTEHFQIKDPKSSEERKKETNKQTARQMRKINIQS